MSWFYSLTAKTQVIIGASIVATLTVLMVGLFLMWNERGEIQSRVEATSRGQTELIGKVVNRLHYHTGSPSLANSRQWPAIVGFRLASD